MRLLWIFFALCKNVVVSPCGIITRFSTKINFVGISIGIPIETSLDFRRNYWSKLSKLIGIPISISIVGIEIPIGNQNQRFYIFL
jgi:hypothetical protein